MTSRAHGAKAAPKSLSAARVLPASFFILPGSLANERIGVVTSAEKGKRDYIPKAESPNKGLTIADRLAGIQELQAKLEKLRSWKQVGV